MSGTLTPARVAAGPATLRIASIPADHVYVRHLGTPGDGVVRLPDPPPAVARPQVGQWWPPVMLDAQWVREHHDEFDLAHVHFGFDAIDPDALSRFVDALDEAGTPLVYTVHDLRNPHHRDAAAHRAHLDVLIPRAAAVLTLTPGAAAVIARDWGRTARVIPHPHVVDAERAGQPARPRFPRFTVGIHAKSVRASMDPGPVIEALLPLARQRPDLRLLVDVHRDVAEADGARHDGPLMELLHRAVTDGLLELDVHDCYSDAELWDYLQGLDLSVLPYRFGTHSGWLEACHDLGTPVLAPTCGFYAEQRRCLSFGMDETGLDAPALRRAVEWAMEHRPRWRADPASRAVERVAIAAAHRQVYEQVRGKVGRTGAGR